MMSFVKHSHWFILFILLVIAVLAARFNANNERLWFSISAIWFGFFLREWKLRFDMRNVIIQMDAMFGGDKNE